MFTERKNMSLLRNNKSRNSENEEQQRTTGFKRLKSCFQQQHYKSNSESLFETSSTEVPVNKTNPSKSRNEFFYLPVPEQHTTEKSSRSLIEKEVTTSASVNNNSNARMMQRKLISIWGRVDFCIKIHKLYPEINALFNIYGKYIKITKGKLSKEKTIIMRSDCGGPILQVIYYDFRNILESLQTSPYIRVVGRFNAEYRLQAYKIENLLFEQFPKEEHFTRIHNVTAFSLLQSASEHQTK